MYSEPPFCIRQEGLFALPILHYTMESAVEVKRAFEAFAPDCVAVELPQDLQAFLLHAASRLPDISVIKTGSAENPLYYLAEPCDAAFEALRCAIEAGKGAFCIDAQYDNYPEHVDVLPDAYASTHVGYAAYYEACLQQLKNAPHSYLDLAREAHMARQLKELTLRYTKVLFVAGMHHVSRVLQRLQLNRFSDQPATSEVSNGAIYTLTESACRQVMAECGFITRKYEEWREGQAGSLLDRQQILYELFDKAAGYYMQESGNFFPRYNLRNLMKFSRNYALVAGKLMPNLFRFVTAARACVDSNYGYEVWKCATDYPFLRNIDNLSALGLTPEEVWGQSQRLRFTLKLPRRKGYDYIRRKEKEGIYSFRPLSNIFLCSYPPEDIAIERFGKHLKMRGKQMLLEEQMRVVPFSTSLEEGVDMRETIRHWQEGQLYVRKLGRPTGQVGSMVVIFDSDTPENEEREETEQSGFVERYPWKMTWIGEHTQESDMAFYATPLGSKIVGPGISRCEYGGFMLSYPPRRLRDVWRDADYAICTSKSQLLLMSAIDYSLQPVVLYVAQKPPPARMKAFAARFGKKIYYIPLSQLSPPVLQKLRVFHVLDGHHRRESAGEYIV